MIMVVPMEQEDKFEDMVRIFTGGRTRDEHTRSVDLYNLKKSIGKGMADLGKRMKDQEKWMVLVSTTGVVSVILLLLIGIGVLYLLD